MTSDASAPRNAAGGQPNAIEREVMLLEAIRRAEAATANFDYEALNAWLGGLAEGFEFVDPGLQVRFAAQDAAQHDLDVLAMLHEDTLVSIRRPTADVRALVTRLVRFAFLTGAAWGKADAVDVPGMVARQVDRRRAQIANHRLRVSIQSEVKARARELRGRRGQARTAGRGSAAVRAAKRDRWQAIAEPIALEIRQKHGDLKREAFIEEIRARWPEGKVACPKRSRMSRFLVELFGPARPMA